MIIRYHFRIIKNKGQHTANKAIRNQRNIKAAREAPTTWGTVIINYNFRVNQ